MSGPYPVDIQLQILRTMKGLENVEIIKPGYDVEYDFVNPQGTIQHTMETTIISNLYLAGQICGTTGYEEAASQGIIAGINAGKKSIVSSVDDYKPFIIGRDEGYMVLQNPTVCLPVVPNIGLVYEPIMRIYD
jgi:tRNA uridine 5-carboxymethylaminomethyl modification enzyme